LTGVDTTALMLDHATGCDVLRTRDDQVRGAMVLSFFGVAEEGEVTAIEGLDEARRVAGVISLRMLVAVGTRIRAIVTDAHRHGFVITRGSRLDEALQVANRAKALVRVVVR
jgi:hypothetical protein